MFSNQTMICPEMISEKLNTNIWLLETLITSQLVKVTLLARMWSLTSAVFHKHDFKVLTSYNLFMYTVTTTLG